MRLLIYVGPVAMPPSSHQLLLPPTGKAHFQYFQWERMRPTHRKKGEREREAWGWVMAVGLGMSFWQILANEIERDVCWDFPKRFSSLTGVCVVREEEGTFSSLPFFCACDPIMWDHSFEHMTVISHPWRETLPARPVWQNGKADTAWALRELLNQHRNPLLLYFLLELMITCLCYLSCC